MTIQRLLVANRGEIASRVFRTCRERGIGTVAVFSDADADLPYVAEADVAVRLPGTAPADTYLRADLLVEAARRAGADAVHPGYGFLSENAGFARAVEAAGLTWVGPRPETIEQMGSKVEAKRIAAAAGVPVLSVDDLDALTAADLPLLVKASAGGGGRGMRIVRDLSTLDTDIAAAREEAASAFGDGTVFVEPYVEHGRHVEVQVWGDHAGTNLSVLGARDCSVQRRHQKVVEEAPPPDLMDEELQALYDAAEAIGRAISYEGVGTVEFLVDADPDREDDEPGRFWFLEMNTRLQVEHPVTEEVTGLDLVGLQLDAAVESDWGRGIGFAARPGEERALVRRARGHAIEVRLYAEDPAADHRPTSGTLTAFDIPGGPGIRVEAGYRTGSEVSTHYDAMLAKVVAHGDDRDQAAQRLAGALARARIHGLTTNRDQLVQVLRDPDFLAERVSTAFLVEHPPAPVATDPGVAVAAALAVVAAARARARVQTRVPAGWRSVTSAPQTVTFDGLEPVAWWGTRDGYAVEGLEVVAATPAAVTLERDGLRTTWATTVRGLPGRETVDVDGPGGHAHLVRTPRFTDPGEQVASGSLTAAMPGTVVRLDVAVGDAVTAGQPLLVLEAMKMQHTVSAPADGTVTAVAVAQGQQVAAGDVLAVVETSDEESA